MVKKNIFIILPFKESLNPKLAGAVSLYVKDTTKYSKFKKNIKIISSEVSKNKFFRNKNYILDFCKKYKHEKIDIIELHNRPEYVKYIIKYFPNSKVILFFHNDPLSLRDSQSISEREYLLNKCSKLIFISRWVQKRFYTSFLNLDYEKTKIIYHGVKKIKKITSKKNNNILFVGKLNEAKGYTIFVDAAKKFKKNNKNWNFIAIGNEPRKKIFPDKNIVNEIGYKTNDEVLNYYSSSEIAVSNSVWEEPLGRLPIEASSRKCLPIISNIAGLNESKRIAYVLKENNSSELCKLLIKLTKSKSLREKLQNQYYLNNNFDLIKISKSIDNERKEIIETQIKKLKNKKFKILHIANFNELSDGRLFYSFANKLNAGFVKENHIVQTISDKINLKYNKNFLNPNGNFKYLNSKIENTINNFRPNLVIFGHVNNIDNRIFKICEQMSIKTACWYIDSISPEFLNGKKKNNFIELVNNVDKCFITSDPVIFKQTKIFKKLRFIPNPVDKAIDNLSNFKENNLEYDVFFAISHGQNRAILKKGKTDEREDLYQFLINKLSDYKVASFGMNNIEPIWGSNFFYHLSKSKIAINISRGKYQNLYSSDRISSLLGNGLLVFIESKTKLNKIFKDKKEVIFFKNKYDLIKKIIFYLKRDKLRMEIAKRGHNIYHKKFSNINLVKFILNELNLTKDKIHWFNK